MIGELIKKIKEIGIPVRYKVFKSKTSVPFLVYYKDSSSNFMADGKVYFKLDNYIIELYSEEKSFELEEKIEEVFKMFDVPWNKEDEYIESEKLNMTTYYFNAKGE